MKVSIETNERETSHYRLEIDGLRAVAVIAVIIYHFNKAWLPGGYLGVDMFFVISGYVILSSVSRQPPQSFYDFVLNFYSRRMKRLLPALAVCLVGTFLIGAAFISPDSRQYLNSFRASYYSLIGASNLYFYSQAADYFAEPLQRNIFTHTWSLGVEEQFYIVFPVLYWYIYYGLTQPSLRRYALLAVAFALALSLVAFAWSLNTKVPGAYFLSPLRIWELGAGCLVFYVPLRRWETSRIPAIWAMWGAWFILVAGLMAPEALQIYASPAAVAAIAVLLRCLMPASVPYRLLTNRAVVYIGTISYSLYLWHWGVLTIGRLTIGQQWWSKLMLLGLVVVLAVISHTYVEKPLRYRKWAMSSAGTIGRGVTAITLVCCLFGLLGGPLRGSVYLGERLHMAAMGVSTLSDVKYANGKQIWPAGHCIIGAGRKISMSECTVALPTAATRRFLVIGNSVSAAEFEMYLSLPRDGYGSVAVTSSWGASPVMELPNSSPWSTANDYYWSTVIPEMFSQLKRGDFVVMVNELSDLSPEVPSSEADNRLSLLESGLSRLVENLREKGISVVFQTVNPFIRDSECSPDMAKHQWFNIKNTELCKYYSRDYSLARRSRLHGMLQRLADVYPNFFILDLFPVLCPGETCKIFSSDGVPLYRDSSAHPSVEAALLAQPLLAAVVQKAIDQQSSGTLGTESGN